jgi:hypothetical protein
MNKKIRDAVLIAGFGVVLFVAPVAALAQDEPMPVVESAEEPADEIELPEWVINLTIGGVFLAPLVTSVTQIIKAVGNRFGILPDGSAGYVVLTLSFIAVLVAGLAEVLNAEANVGANIETAQHIAEALLTVLSALGWYEVGKRAEIIRPIARG